MAEKRDLLEDLNYLSSTVSERTRVIAFGIIAIWWAALIGKDAPHDLTFRALTGPVVLSALAIFLDLAQYGLSYILYRQKLYEVERDDLEEFTYDTSGMPYKIRQGLFYGKQALMLIGLLWLVRILLPLAFQGVTWNFTWNVYR